MAFCLVYFWKSSKLNEEKEKQKYDLIFKVKSRVAKFPVKLKKRMTKITGEEKGIHSRGSKGRMPWL